MISKTPVFLERRSLIQPLRQESRFQSVERALKFQSNGVKAMERLHARNDAVTPTMRAGLS
jgi:hypothetical protein